MKFAFAPESKPLDGYTIKRAIHRGGFGEVYYALTDAGKEVALKLLRQNMEVELRGVSQCLNLKHPNLVTIFDIKTDSDGDHWIVMEYVSGRTLDEIMEQYPNGMPIAEVNQWMEGLLKGLAFLHDRGIVHRDLKPANLFTEEDQIKIGDIGLSKFITQSRRSAQTQSVGTVYYMAPEVAHGKYGHEVDVYALGVILYEMLTGHVPFEGESTGEILMKHLTEKPDVSALPVQYQSLVAQALEKDPHKRTSSVALFANQFHAAGGNDVEPLEIPVQSFQPNVVSSDAKTQRYSDDGITAPESKKVSPPPFPEAAPKQPHTAKPKSKENYRQPGPTTEAGLAGQFMYHIGQWFGSFTNWWKEQSTGMQVGLIVLAVVLAETWIPLTIVASILGFCVLIGLMVIDLFTGANLYIPTADQVAAKPPPTEKKEEPLDVEQASYSKPSHPHPEVEAYRQKYREKYHRKQKMRQCQPKTERQIGFVSKMTELFGSMSLAAVYVGLIVVAFQMFMSAEFNRHGATPTFWSGTICLGTVTLLSVWGILVVSKLLEGSGQPAIVRRLCMMPVALVVSVAAVGLIDYLMVSMDYSLSYNGEIRHFMGMNLTERIEGDKVPTFWGMLVFMGGMMFVRQWWLMCDNYRVQFFRLASVFFSVGVAFIWTLIFAFPVELALIWSTCVSVVLQIVSPWTPPEKRALPQEGM